MSTASADAALSNLTPVARRALRIVNASPDTFAFTDLTKTKIGGDQNRFFRLFTPVKRQRMRLPTSLPEFRNLRHYAPLSDSPVTTASHLGGHWTDYNLAAITQVAACNFRCSYCYVDFRHLAGADSFIAGPADLVDEFVALRTVMATQGQQLSILRISGGEPLLAPRLLIGVYDELVRRDLLDSCILKVESNASMLPVTVAALDDTDRARLAAVAPHVTLHVTIHARPGTQNWDNIVRGLGVAVRLGFDLYPAIGGADWPEADMRHLYRVLAGIAPGLPLRLAVRPFNLTYAMLRDRRNLPRLGEGNDPPSSVWEGILRESAGIEYLARPRHEIPLIPAVEEAA